MSNSTSLIFIYELMGSKHLSRLLCFIAKYHGVSSIILLGDTVSPEIIQWLSSKCKVNIYGVLGRLDNASIANTLRNINGLIECKATSIKNVVIYGYGFSGCSHKLSSISKVDVLVTSIPGLKYTCCGSRSDIVDDVVEAFKPRLIITGDCMKPCFKDNVFSPGSIRKGFIGLVEVKDLFPTPRWVNIYDFIINVG